VRPRFPWLLVFAFTGALSLGACQTTDGPFVDTGVESGRCATCHLREYSDVKHPAHAGAKPTTCGVCHATTSWHPTLLNHSWALTGAHAKADCFGCHRDNPPVFQGTHSECVDCHRSDYDKSRFPGHSRFPLTCAECHSTAAWKPTLPEAASSAAPAEPTPPVASPSRTPPARAPLPKAVPAPTPTPRPRTPSVPPRQPPSPTPTPPPDSVTGASRRPRR